MIERLELQNFTGFDKLTLNFSPKINVIIGENGTGKTHVLKAAYALCMGAVAAGKVATGARLDVNEALTHKLLRLFMPLEGELGKMHKRGTRARALLQAHLEGGNKIEAAFGKSAKQLSVAHSGAADGYERVPVFIPTKEVLSLVKGIANTAHDRGTLELIFDDGYLDLAAALMNECDEEAIDRVNENPRVNAIIPALVELIGGRYQRQDAEFYFQPGEYKEKMPGKRARSKSAQMYQDSTITRFVPAKGDTYASGMTAEGFRKIGMLHLLLSNGAIDPGETGPLFWDEPESNLNPKLMKLLVQTMLELARNGLQVIIATHDYVLLKWIDLLMDKGQEDHVRYHTLSRSAQTGSLECEESDSYESISRSAISDAFAELYDEDVRRALG